MSELEKLIKELCPDGVEYKAFFDICDYIRGITYNKNDEINDGSSGIKILRANNITLETNTLNFDDIKTVSNDVKIKEIQRLKKNDILICAGSGSKEHIGKVAYIFENIDYTFGGFMGVVRPKTEDLKSRYLFHILTSDIFKKHLAKMSSAASSTINNINNDTWKDFKIPLPPLPVQQEIVRILDNFTKLTKELTKELTARKKQYEHYRDALLSFDDIRSANQMDNGGRYNNNVIYRKLGEICEIGKGIQFNKENMQDKGSYPVINGGINPSGYIEQFNNDENTITISQGGASAGYVNWIKTKFWAGAHCYIVKPLECILNRYIFHFIKSQEHRLQECQYGAGIPALSKSTISELSIPVPPLETQRRIVSILDKFEMLANSLSDGLPAEIEARKKQYEYYRDKLLDFKDVGGGIAC